MNCDSAVVSDHLLYDMNNDGRDELVFIADSLNALNSSGTNIPGFPRPLRGVPVYSMGPVVVPAAYHPGGAIIWPTRDSLYAAALESDSLLPGWPVSIPYEHDLTSPVVIPTGDGWVVAYTSRTQVFCRDSTGELLRGFPAYQSDSWAYLRNFSAGDVDGDGVAEILIFKAGVYNAINLQGRYLPGFPTQEFRGHGDQPIVFQTASSDSAFTFVTTRLQTNIQSWMMGLHYNQSIEGFPVDFNGLPLLTVPSLATIWQEGSDTLHLVFNSNNGGIMVWDLPMPGETVRLEWPMPGGDPRGARVYQPSNWMGVEEETYNHHTLPNDFRTTIYPNPTNAGALIHLDVPWQGTVEIVNILGQLVWSGRFAPNQSTLYWPGTTTAGSPLPSGRYFLRPHASQDNASSITLLR